MLITPGGQFSLDSIQVRTVTFPQPKMFECFLCTGHGSGLKIQPEQDRHGPEPVELASQ